MGQLKTCALESDLYPPANQKLSRPFLSSDDRTDDSAEQIMDHDHRMTAFRSTLSEQEENLTEAYTEYRYGVRNLLRKLQRREQQLAISVNKNRRLEREVEDRDAMIRKVQESAFAQVDPAEWKPDEDSVVTCAFQDLDKAIQSWSRKFALRSSTSWPSLTAAETQRFRAALKDFVLTDSSDHYPEAFNHHKLNGKISAMLVQAWACNHIYHCIVARPFFFIDNLYAAEHAGVSSDDRVVSRVLEAILEATKQGQSFQVSVTRVQN